MPTPEDINGVGYCFTFRKSLFLRKKDDRWHELSIYFYAMGSYYCQVCLISYLAKLMQQT